MNQTAIGTSASTLLSDTLGQVTPSVLASGVSEAWNDMWVALPIFDTTSLVFNMSVYEYAVPATMTSVDAIYIQRASGIFPEELDSGLWEVINGNIVFSKQAGFRIPDGYQLEIRGKYKLGPNDNIPATNYALINYVTTLATWIILRSLTFKKIVAFLNNDTSVAELISFRQTVERDVIRYRQQLTNSYINA